MTKKLVTDLVFEDKLEISYVSIGSVVRILRIFGMGIVGFWIGIEDNWMRIG